MADASDSPVRADLQQAGWWQRHGITTVWLLLVAATCISAWLGLRVDDAVEPSASSSVMILVIAMFKVRLVIQHFMEVRHAPWPLRLICEVWVLGVCALMVGLFLLK